MKESNINIPSLKKYNPIKATVFGILFWLLLFVLFPLNVKYPLSFLPVLYIVLNYLFFLIGLSALKTVKLENQQSYLIDYKVLKKIMNIIMLIAFVGLMLKVLDRFYIRGSSFENSMSENRELLSQSGPSIISIISAVTNPFCFLPLFIYYFTKSRSKILLVFCLALFFSASIEFLVLGSRSGLFILLVLFLIYLFYFKKIKLTFGKILLMSIIAFFVGVYSINLFIERTLDFAPTEYKAVRHIITNANYNYTIEPTEDTKKDILTAKNKTYRAVRLGTTNFVQYYLHGMYEFGYLYNNYKTDEHYYGKYTFMIFYKFSNILLRTDIDLNEANESNPRRGIYTTFFGPIYTDFGWLSLVFMFFFGVYQKNLYNKALRGRFQYVPLLFYMLIIDFFIPVINFIRGAQGLYTISAFLIFAYIYTLLSGKLIISKENNIKQFIKILKPKS